MRSLALAVWCVAGGCFASKASVAPLQAGFEVASQRAQAAETSVGRMEDRLAALESTLRDLGLDRAAGRQSVEAFATEIAALRGAVEEVRFATDQLRADFDQVQLDQERRTLHAEARLAQVERLLGVQPPPPPRVDGVVTAPETAPLPASEGVPAPGSYEERLALAATRITEGQQAAARAMLEALLREDPDHARATEAQYRLAETWFNEGKWREAARAFQVITDRSAKSTWAPWAMLRIGECFDGMGRASDAKTFYEGVVRNFAGSDAAREATRKLGR